MLRILVQSHVHEIQELRIDNQSEFCVDQSEASVLPESRDALMETPYMEMMRTNSGLLRQHFIVIPLNSAPHSSRISIHSSSAGN